MLFLAIGLLITQVLILSGGIYAYVKVRGASRVVEGFVSELFISQAEGEPPAIIKGIAAISEDMAQRIGISTQAAIRGSIGGTMKGINHALEEEAVAQDPGLALMNALPKSLKKNPLAVMGLQAILSKMQTRSPGIPNNAGDNGSNPVRFNL